MLLPKRNAFFLFRFSAEDLSSTAQRCYGIPSYWATSPASASTDFVRKPPLPILKRCSRTITHTNVQGNISHGKQPKPRTHPSSLALKTRNVSASRPTPNILYAIIHPFYSLPSSASSHKTGSTHTAIPSPDGAKNHSPGFRRAARTEAAHTAALRTAALLAHTGFRIHADGAFCARVRAAYEAGADATTSTGTGRWFVHSFVTSWSNFLTFFCYRSTPSAQS